MMSITQKSRVSFMVCISFALTAMFFGSGMSVAGGTSHSHQKDQDKYTERDQDQQHLHGVLAEDGCSGLVWLIGEDLAVSGGDGDARAAIVFRLTLDDDASTG